MLSPERQLLGNLDHVHVQLCVHVQVPLCESLLAWLCELDLSLATLSNREIAAFVHDQIAPLNITRLRVAKLVRKEFFDSYISGLQGVPLIAAKR
jgi:hypothetical protein